MSTENVTRRQPKQARSQQRVDRVLDAAAQLFEEVGYEHTTTNAIATRAGVAIGSLYQFFPNKEAVMAALVSRYVDALHVIFQYDLTQPLDRILSGMLDGLLAFKSSNAGFHALFMSSHAAGQIHNTIAGVIQKMLTERFPTFDPQSAHQVAVVSIAIVKGMLDLMNEDNTSIAPEMLYREINVALLAYLRTVLLREGVPLPPEMV